MRLTYTAMLVPAFAHLVALPSAHIPVAGQIANTDTLLGRGGVVLGQRAGPLVPVALAAAQALAASLNDRQ